MTVKDIVKVQAMLVGREDVVDYLSGKTDNPDTATLATVDLMTRCINLTISELASTYIPMVERFVSQGTEIFFSDLTDNILEILSVTDSFGNRKKYKFSPEKISGLNKGDVLEYSFLPPNYGLDERVGFSESKVPIRLLAYAGASEYCLTERAFDESVMWRNRYVSELSELIKPKNCEIKARRWY